jgi:predicted flap endonuclease-1-like 5' DNA nuclease
MKISYVLIGVFVVWCIIASQWYLFGVKGLLTDPAHFRPHETTMAIIEILIMLLVAVLIGFGIAWFLRKNAIDQSQSTIADLHNAHKLAISEAAEARLQAEKQTERAEQKLARAQETFKEDFQNLSKEKDRIKLELDQNISEAKRKQEEILTLKPKAQLADVELGRITFQVKQLENQLAESKSANQKLETELEECRATKSIARKEPVYSDFIAGQRLGISEASAEDKDDLKLISGIGPVIERKLNDIGIYTFKQISEFTPVAVEQVTAAIKFFPDRIGRDNWIGQAAAFLRHRK